MNIVLVGAGGTGISSLGFLLRELGYTNIIGIDANVSQITEELQKAGVKMHIGNNTYTINSGDIVIYSDACIQSPEVQLAQKLYTDGVKNMQPPYSYFQFLGEISKFFETIAIAGTHGKSTTTALATYTMKIIDGDFGLGILGALVPQLGNRNYWKNDTILPELQTIFNYILIGKPAQWDETLRKKYRFLIEADEFNRHFLYLDTDYAIILNAELDHSDVYKNEDEYLQTYLQFISKVKKQVFALQGEKGIAFLHQHSGEKITLIDKKQIDFPYIFGDHNQKNASLILALLEKILGEYLEDTIGIEKTSHITQTMGGFQGLRRRMELLKKFDNDNLLYTDYGHHPTEIQAVYNAMREKYTDKKLIAIFQPHQLRRVLQFWNEFIDVLKQFDEVVICDIYAARENIEDLLEHFPIPGYTKDTPLTINELGELFAKECNGTYTTSFDEITTRITSSGSTQDNEVICIFSAGNLDFAIRKYLEL